MEKTVFWSALVGILVAIFATFSNILVPFLIAFILAYLLRPLVDNKFSHKLPRNALTYGIFIVFLSSFIIAFTLLMPVLCQQIFALVNKIPSYREYLQTELIPVVAAKIHTLDPSIANKVSSSLQSFINGIFSMLSGIAANIWGGAMATINIFTIILLVPIILFYFLRDWKEITNDMESLIPLKNKIREILSSINKLLSAYIRGQLNICVILAVFYAIFLSIIGIDLAVVLGTISGFLIIIPFIGTMISFSLAIIVGYFTFGLSIKLLYIAILYITGILLEGYILTPKIIGDKIGLHPLWIMFAVFAGGSLFGIIGIIFAVPFAGIVKVLLKHTTQWYKSSKIYKA